MRRTETTWPIVAGVDGTNEGEQAALYAAELAASWGNPLTLLHAYRPWRALHPVVPPEGPPVARAAVAAVTSSSYGWTVNDALAQDAGERVLDTVDSNVQRVHPGLETTTLLVAGSPAEALTTASRTSLAVVVARSRNHLVHVIGAGSTTNAVAAHSEAPVIVLPTANEAETCEEVVLGLEGQQSEIEAVDFAFRTAMRTKVPLHIIHSMRQLDPAHRGSPQLVHKTAVMHQLDKRAIAESLACWADHYPEVSIAISYSPSAPVDALLDAVGPQSLLVIGARAGGGLPGLHLGSTSRSMLSHAPCPVAVVRTVQHPRHATSRHSSGESELAEAAAR